MPDNDESGRLSQSRRQWIKYMLATGVTAGLAGCGGDGGGATATETEGAYSSDTDSTDDNEPTATAVQESYDGYFRLPAVFNLGQADFNMWNPNSNLFYPTRMIWEGFTEYSVSTGEYMPTGATDWNYDGSNGEMTIELRDDMTWHDGTDVVAEHVHNHFVLGELRSWPPWSVINGVSVEDEYTLSFDLVNGAESFIKPTILGGNWTHWFWTHPEYHREFIESAKDATTEEEMNSINGKLSEFSISGSEAVEKGVGFGPFAISEYSEGDLYLEPHEEYPWGLGSGDGMAPNYKGVRITDFGSSESDFHEAAIADQIDGFTGTTSSSVREQMGDHWSFIRNPNWGQHGITFGPDSKWGKNTDKSRALRQAVGFFYNPDEWVKIRQMPLHPDPNMATGLNTPQDNNYISDVIGDFTNYGNSESGWTDMQRAKQKMKEAGYTKDGDWWVDGNGNRLSVEIKYNAEWTANHPGYENVAEQFRSFGIDASTSAESNTQLLNNTAAQHNFEIMLLGTGFGPHPYDAFVNSLGTINANYPSGSVYTNQIKEVDIPMPVGDPDGEMTTFNIDKKLKEYGSTTDQAKVDRLTKEFAWMWNQWVPAVEMETKVRVNYVASDNWQWNVSTDAPQWGMEQPWVYCTRSGDLRGKPE